MLADPTLLLPLHFFYHCSLHARSSESPEWRAATVDRVPNQGSLTTYFTSQWTFNLEIIYEQLNSFIGPLSP